MTRNQALICLLLILLLIPTLQICDATTCGDGFTCNANGTCATCGTYAGLTSYLYTVDSYCYVNCPAQSYKDTSQAKCLPCSTNCNGCSGSAINCITCEDNYFRVIGSSQCTDSCGGGFYGDSNTAYCTACPQGCSLCSKPSTSVQCSACTSVAGSQYYLTATSCVAVCPPGTYGGTGTSGPQCVTCGGFCATCKGSNSFCLTCSAQKKLAFGLNSCGDNCPNGQYDPGSGICALCSSNCATCSDFSTCLTCGLSGGAQTYKHSDNHCYAICPNGYYGGTSNSQKLCILCDNSCNGCSLTATNCLACANTYFRQIGLNSCTQTCGDGYYGESSTSLCTACPVGCSLCAKSGSTITCSACQAVAGVTYFSLNSNSCVSKCPSNQYGNSSNNQCTTCDNSCLTCSGGASNNCLTCPLNKYLGYNLGICYSSCPDGSYAPASSFYCLPCNVNCKTCSSNSTNCQTCGVSVNGITLYLLDSTKTCVSSCPATEYGNNSTNTCDQCNSSCQTCKGPGAGDCLTCASGNLNFTSYCVSSCGNGKYSSGGVCYSCLTQCSTCNSATACTGCNVVLGIAYYLQSNISSCVVSCPSGSYADSIHGQCMNCTSPCASCVNSDTYCLSCVASKYLVYGQNSCANSCPDGQYVITGTYTCGLCSVNCKTCSGGNSSNCGSCGLASNGLQLFLYTDSRCYSSCPNGFYGSTTNYQCTGCDSTCDGCTLSSTNCIKCASNKFRLIGSNQCGSCPDGYYGYSITNLCTICPTGCTTCTSPSACAGCASVAGLNYYLLNGTCLQICPIGKFGDTSGSAPVCTDCPSTCISCTSSSVCLTCATGNVLRYGTSVCASSCLDGSYNGGSGYCLACSIYCKTCVTSADNCQSCNSLGGVGYYLNSNKCTATCPINYYADSSSLTCVGCAVGCQKCSGPNANQCTSCKAVSSTPYYLRYGTTTCSQTCLDGQYSLLSTFQCLLCASSCLTCSNNSTNCVTCGFSSLFGVDLFFYNNQCLLTCPAKFYGRFSDHTCQSCATGCASCYNSTSTTCYSCANVSGTIYYKYNGVNTCDTGCPNGQFISNSVPFVCQLCSSTCITCSMTAQNCTNTNCSINYYYLNNSCLSVCPSGYYTDSAQRQCFACATGCKTCFNSGSNSCYSCLTLANTTSYYLSGVSSCSTYCDNGFYANSTINLCLACVPACANCTSLNTCQSCQSVNGVAYYLSNNTCIILCPVRYYGQSSNFTCMGCADGCYACFGATLSTCYNCTDSASASAPYFLQYATTKCTPNCPSNQYKNTTSYQCLLCSPTCLTCQNTSTNCLSCGLSTTGVNLFLYNNKCLAVCPISFWANSNTSTCNACTTGCLRCTSSGLNACTQCSNDSSTIYYLYIGATTCSSTNCPDGQYISSSVPNYCQPCSSICVTCSVSAENCTSSSCAQNFYFLNNSCLASCPDNYFNNVALRQCTKCTTGCQSCYSSGLNSCTACQSLANGTKYYLQIGVNTCDLSCNQGEFKNSTTLKCVACRSACKTCTDTTTCQSCQNVDGLAYFLTSNTCSVACPIGTYGEISNYQCTSCFTGCKTCFASTQSDCSSCKNNGTHNFYLTYGTTICNLTCPDGTYQNSTSFLCLMCSPLCKTCTTNATYCTSCGLSTGGLPLFLENGTCIVNCVNGYYQDPSNNTCTACDTACKTCNDATKNYCFSCGNVTVGVVTTQYYLYIGATVCNNSCPVGQFISASNSNNCQMCDSNCVGCSGTATNCSQDKGCKANLFYNNATNTCVLVCPDGTFGNTVTKFCENCTHQCALCYGAVSSKCTKCQPVNALNYFRQINKDLCIQNCATGEYGDSATLLCQLCSPACAVCTNSAFNCSSCRSVNGVAYFLQGTNCVVSCPIGRYGRISDFTCVGCATGCFSCTGPADTDCQSCKNQVVNYYLVFNTNWCNSSCPDGQYANSTNFKCMLCSSQCLTCANTSRNCLTCGFSQYGFTLFLYNNQCLQTCPNKFWPNTAANTCDACHQACLLCTSSDLNSCSSCGNITSTIYYKYTKANTCSTTCPPGQYISLSIPNFCQPCSINCVTCSGTAENCTSSNCSANYFFLNNSCLTTCPDNYYADVTLRQCIKCTAGCQSCFSSGLNSCTKCSPLVNGTSYFLQINQTTCGPVCNPGEYQFSLTFQCVSCNPVCATCTSYSICQSCQSLNGVAYYLDSNSCIIKCPSFKFGQLSNFTCLNCPSQCLTCFGGTVDKCYSCNTSFYLIYGRTLCNNTCSDGTYSDSSTNLCLLCAPQCLTCSGNASYCLSCGFSSIGSNLYLSNNQCLLSCPIRTWANLVNHNCDACHASCISCTSSGQNSCQSCGNITATIYYKYIGVDTCNTTCPDGQFISASIPNFCQPCSPICITCVNSSEICTNLNCSQNYFYLNNSCLSICPDNYYADLSLRQCIQCTPGCQTCFGLGLNSCTKCNMVSSTHYYLQIGLTTCAAGCNPGQYRSNLSKICAKCNPVCAMCTSSSVCQSCQTLYGVAYFLSNSSCIYACPFGQYGNLNDYTCYTCATGCLTCFASDAFSCYNCTAANVSGTMTDFFLEYSTTKCQSFCPSGQYKNVTSYRCQLCDQNCKTCVTTSTNCLSCGFSSIGAQLYLYQSTCLLSCPDQFFPNTTTKICDNCFQGCLICTGSSSQNCTVCRTANNSGTLTPYYKYIGSNVCNTTCPTGQLISGKYPNICQTCDPGCAACFLVSTNCSIGACKPGYFYFVVNSSCLTACPNNYYANTTTGYCTQCTAGCALCYGTGLNFCTRCQITGSSVPYFKVIDIDTCNTTCPAGQYPYQLLLACQYCSAPCLTCNTSATDCQSCKNVSGVPYFNLNNQCLLNCPDSYYGQLSNNTCVSCVTGCALCFGGNNVSCTQCKTVTGVVYYLVYGSTNCSLSCPPGQYRVDYLNACNLCDTNCFTCDKSSTNCTSCFLTSTGIRLYLQNNLCVQSCKTGSYQNSTDNTCQSCNIGCLVCTGPSLFQCQACRDAIDPSNASNTLSYYLNIGNMICSLQCPVGQFKRAGYPNACQPCAVQCIGCSVSSTNCTQSYLCTIGYYFFRVTNSCLTACPSGYYANSTTRYCEVCPGGCSLCKAGNLNSCQQCKQDNSTGINYYKQIYMESCVTTCLNGEYSVPSDFSCQPCHASCVLCNVSSTACQQCKNVSGVNYFYYSNGCLLNCPNGYYGQKSNNTCVVCNPACPLCFGPSTTQCYSCQPDTTTTPATYYYLSYGTTYCVTVCPYGQYAVNGSFTCQYCNINCATCQGSATNCLTCTYINTINIVYLYQNKCVVTCPGGLWQNSTAPLDHRCSPCHSYCTLCTGPSNTQCSACGNQTTPFVMYYKDRYSTTCNPTCPIGQYIDSIIPNLCVPCDFKCLKCNVSSTNCSKCALGYFLYVPMNSCTAMCPPGYFNDPTVTSNNYYCSTCTPGCLTCNGPTLNNCQTCQNVTQANDTIVSYFKDVTGSFCVNVCSLGYYGNVLNNNCDPCQIGCVSCQYNKSYCFSCRSEGGSDYFKPKASNSCVTVCPNGYYGNSTDYTCRDCIYYTFNGNCVLSCPTGYFPQMKSSKTICQDCNDPSAVGNPCNRSYTFSVSTAVVDNGNSLQHKVLLPKGLSPNVTVQQLMNNLSVKIEQPSRRRLEEVQIQEISKYDRNKVPHLDELVQISHVASRFLLVSTPLSVKNLRISDDRTVIYITTDYASADFSVANVKIDFSSTALVSSDGLLYQSTTASFQLSSPSFQQSLFKVFAQDIRLGAEGMIFILLGIILLIFQLVITNRKGYHEIISFIMLLQVMGLLRIRQFPINFNIYSVLIGFSYFELSFLPNGFSIIFPPSYQQTSLSPVAFALGSHNSILNLGAIIQTFFFFELCLFVYFVCRREKPEHLARMKLYQQTLVVLFMVIIVYDSILAAISLSINNLTALSAQFLGSIAMGILLLIFYLVYIIVWVRPYRLFQLYKINNMFRVIGLGLLPINHYAGLIIIDLADLAFIVIDIVLYRSEKINFKAYLVERIFTLIALNTSIFATSSISLLVVGGLSIFSIFIIKVYYTVLTVKEYIDERKKHGASEIDVSDVVNASVKAKDKELSSESFESKVKQSESFIHNESLDIDKYDEMPSRNKLFDLIPKESRIDESDEQEQKKADVWPEKQIESEASHEEMIVYLDPEDYKEQTRKKQEQKKNTNIDVRPTTNQKDRKNRRNMRTDAIRTTTGFYPTQRNRDIIQEQIEVIKVKPKEQSEESSDIVSDSSDGAGWLDQNDERNMSRAKNNKLVWKIIEEESPFKRSKKQ